MHIQPFQAVYPNTELITSADYFFSMVKERFTDFVGSGFFKKTPHEGLYIHRIAARCKVFTGLVACVDIQDYLDGYIKKHENTLADCEQQQMHLLLQRSSQVKPVMLTYRKVPEIQTTIEQYADKHSPFLKVHFESTDEHHHFWEIQDGQVIQQLQILFRDKVPATYIADGHHRTSSAALLFIKQGKKKPESPFRWLTAAFYATDQLEIHDFNRIVEGLGDLTPTVFMAKISQVFDIEILNEPTKPAQKHELTMYLDKEWFRLRWRQHVLEEFSQQSILLDVTLLNEKVLKGILNIKEVRTDERVKYLEGPKGIDTLKEKTLKSEERLAFCLFPVSMEDFLAVSDAGGVLPPKSTWFEPRIRSGLLVNQF